MGGAEPHEPAEQSAEGEDDAQGDEGEAQVLGDLDAGEQ